MYASVMLQALLKDNKQDFLQSKFEDLFDTLTEVTKKKFSKFLSEKDKPEVIVRCKEDIKLILYNHYQSYCIE